MTDHHNSRCSPKRLTVRKQNMECNHEGKDLAEVAKQELEDGVGDLGGEEHILPDPGDAGHSGHEDVTGPDEGHGRDVPALCDQNSHPAHPAEMW